MVKTQPDWTDVDRDALKHAWDWFNMHAIQRMQSFSLMLASFTLGLAGYGVAFQAGNHLVAAVVAVVGIMLALIFGVLDQRNRELVRAAEAALDPLQKRLAAGAGVDELRLVAAVDRPKLAWISVTWVVRATAIGFGVIFFVAMLVAIVFAATSGAITPKAGL